jgi:hypothetical protein
MALDTVSGSGRLGLMPTPLPEDTAPLLRLLRLLLGPEATIEDHGEDGIVLGHVEERTVAWSEEDGVWAVLDPDEGAPADERWSWIEDEEDLAWICCAVLGIPRPSGEDLWRLGMTAANEGRHEDAACCEEARLGGARCIILVAKGMVLDE